MKRALGALLSLLLGALLAEGAVRFIGGGRFGSLSLVPWDPAEPIEAGLVADAESSYIIFDAELGWQVGPSRHSRNGLYNSDALGARVSGDLPEGTEPWATAFGDSFTHGDDVHDGETWLARLGERGLPIVNLGVPGYGVDQAWLRYRKLKSKVSSPVVLIGVMADNIARHLNRYRPFITPEERIFYVKPRFEKGPDGLTLLPSPFQTRADYAQPASMLRSRLVEIGARDGFFDPRFHQSSAFDASRLFRILRTLQLDPAQHAGWRRLYESPAATDLTLAIVSGFVTEVRSDGRLPVIVFLPERSVAEDVLNGRRSPAAAFVERLRSLSCPLVDLTVPVSGFLAGSSAGDPFRPHYSPGLSLAIADYIVRWKTEEKSLP